MLTNMSAVLENQKKIHNPNWVFPEAVVDVYCGTHPTNGGLCDLWQGSPIAVSWIEAGRFYNTYNVLLCPRFFSDRTSLLSLLHSMSTGEIEASNAAVYDLSWGHTVYHELTHLWPVIANEEVWDVTYGACLTAKLANQNGCSGKVFWDPTNWDREHGAPHSLINADSFSYFASGSFFQKAMQLKTPGRPINDCGIFNALNYNNYTISENGSLSYFAPTVNATGDAFYARVPPDPAPENVPPDDPPTPSLPYVLSDLPPGLATPFDAISYFASYTPAAVSSASAPPPQSTMTPPAAYVTGSCAFHLTETWTCTADSQNLYAVVKLVDGNKTDIGDTPLGGTNRIGSPINAADPYSFTSKLPYPIIIVGEHENDYIQFTYAGLSWKSTDSTGLVRCNAGGWDPRAGPVCGRYGNQNAVKNMDCFFPC